MAGQVPDGQQGGDGEDGPELQAWVALARTEPPLLQVRVLVGQTRELFYQVDPKGGSLSLRSEGGPGGAGGQGGRGGSGGRGGDGVSDWIIRILRLGTVRAAVRGGEGAPGLIVVRVDPRALPYLDRFDIGGHARGPEPQMIAEPVVPWW